MSNITKNHKVGIFAIFLASALLMGTISVTGIDSAFANDSEQKIEQENEIEQDSFCVDAGTSGIGNGPQTTGTLDDCNNIGLGLNLDLGNMAGGQK